MDLREAKLILEKINRLFESMSLDERKIDSFEQDLMMSYTKQFYDSFKYEQAETIPQPIRRKSPPALVEEKPVAPTPPAPIAKAEPKPVPKAEEELTIAIPEAVRKTVTAPAEKVAVTAPAVEKPTPAPVAPPVVKKVKPIIAPNLADLFEFNSTNELSDKLSQQPIPDLTKAIGINERILTINELFDKDSVFFEEKRIVGLSPDIFCSHKRLPH